MNVKTEAQAAKALCPIFTLASETDRSNRHRWERCRGGECMFWRWAGYHPVPGTQATGGGPNDEAHGYCGLAGSPVAQI